MTLDSPVIGVGLFLIAATIIASTMAINAGQSAFSTDTNANNLMLKSQQMFLNMGNSGFVFIGIALILFNILGAFFLPTHPIFAIVDIVFIPISLWIAAIISNSWASSLSTLAISQGYTIMNFMLSNLVMIILAVDVITAIVSYAIVKNAYG